jgi:hypothetical protein
MRRDGLPRTIGPAEPPQQWKPAAAVPPAAPAKPTSQREPEPWWNTAIPADQLRVGGVAWSPWNDLWVCCPKHGVVRVAATGEWSAVAGEMSDDLQLLADRPAEVPGDDRYVAQAGPLRLRSHRVP